MTDTKRRRGPGRRWQPGQSGNPKGRTVGSKHGASIVAENMIEGELQSIVRKLIDCALEGDTRALKIVADRLLPARKGRPLSGVELPTVRSAADVGGAIGKVIAQVGEGVLTPDEGAVVIGYYETALRSIETTELERRILALEKRA